MTTDSTPRVALVTGATQGLGRALVQGLTQRFTERDTVYLTGRDAGRVAAAAKDLGVSGEVLDVAEPGAARRVAEQIRQRHGGIDIVFNNAVMRTGPADPPAAVIEEYVAVNNLGTTGVLRAFLPLLRDGGRAIVVASTFGSLRYLAPALHDRFDDLADLDEVDTQALRWRDAVRDGTAMAGAWPAFLNIPSKIAQVAAIRTVAAQRRSSDLERGVLLAAVCPGMINTPTSGQWWDVSGAPSPEQAAVALLDLALGPVDPAHYGELVRHGEVLPWK
ncbi:SDR family NAD(P)-dependent oxidoreductase [Dactylosporangium siamense]|uniref:Carbonyl reductase n=1 Tax=Dactylosporangium siamense TaxID=685454 RepID=A0A919Q1P3_9ACTN|nr:SDR family NAD(P)-dependent oxidoreductase [Dactylosporangium siamense]GIG52623.1 carbonyl reductase [Dactylosporangium siamense]